MEPINEDRKPTLRGACVPVLPEEIIKTLYRPGPEDWGGRKRDAECYLISAGLGRVMLLAVWEPFASAMKY